MRPLRHGQGGRTSIVSSGTSSVGGGTREQAAGLGEVVLPAGTGEQAVVADATEAAWKDVEQEPTDELVGGERRDPLPFGRIAI